MGYNEILQYSKKYFLLLYDLIGRCMIIFLLSLYIFGFIFFNYLVDSVNMLGKLGVI